MIRRYYYNMKKAENNPKNTVPEKNEPNSPKECKNGSSKKKEKQADNDRFFASKKNVVRFVLFITALVCAVAFITVFVSELFKVEEGYRQVETDYDEALPYFASGVKLTCYFQGTSAEIKGEEAAILNAYTPVLKKTYKMLDPVGVYEDVTGIGAINRNAGKDVAVSYALYDILRDAYEKTKRNEGFSVFSGAANALVNALVWAPFPEEDDPLNNPDYAEYCRRLKALYDDENTFSLIFSEKERTVRLEYSQAYKDFIQEYEDDSPVLDLGILKNAYRFVLIADELEGKGFKNAYLESDDGMIVLLSEAKETDVCFYSPGTAERPVLSATMRSAPSSASVVMRVFSIGDNGGFYTLRQNGKTVYRHKYMTAFNDETPVLSVLTSVKNYRDLPGCAFEALSVLSSANIAEALSRAKAASAEMILADPDDALQKIYLRGENVASVRKEFTVEKI